MRRAKRRDKAEKPIIEALRSVGAQVEQLDVVDLLVRFRGTLYLGEVKTEGATNHRKERVKQAEFCSTWNVPYWYTPEDALRSIGAFGSIVINPGETFRQVQEETRQLREEDC